MKVEKSNSGDEDANIQRHKKYSGTKFNFKIFKYITKFNSYNPIFVVNNRQVDVNEKNKNTLTSRLS